MANTNASQDAAPAGAALPEPPPPTNVDRLLSEMSQMPIFMTSLPDTSSDPSTSNPGLDALRSIAYEGTRAEIATNFKTQGNDCVREKRWADAREFYTKGLAVLRKEVEGQKGDMESQLLAQDPEAGARVVDLEEEERTERALEETLCVNRALCNLELQNYRQVNSDCLAALKLNQSNTKALYRTALANFRLDYLDVATRALQHALSLAPKDKNIITLQQNVTARQTALAKAAQARTEREAREKKESEAFTTALRARNVAIRKSALVSAPADLEDAKIHLLDPVDPASTLVYPVLMLYPTAAQSELLKAVKETETLGLWLDEMLPPPWDVDGEFRGQKAVECYMETVSGGLLKAGKKVLIGEVLGGGKAVVEDGIVRVYCVPKEKGDGWTAEFKRRKGR